MTRLPVRYFDSTQVGVLVVSGRVAPDVFASVVDAGAVRRVLLHAGKIHYDLKSEIEKRGIERQIACRLAVGRRLEPRAFGDKKPFGDNKSFGDKKPYGDKKTNAEGLRNLDAVLTEQPSDAMTVAMPAIRLIQRRP